MKNKKIRLILAIAVFISLIVSSTYAYYAINASGSAHAGFTGNSPNDKLVYVTQQISDLHVHVKETDMSKSNIGAYYATNDDSLNYVKDLRSGTYSIAYISPPGYSTVKQECSMDLKLKTSGSMKKVLHYGDMKLWLRIDSKEKVLDLSLIKNIDEITYKLKFNLKGSGYKNIEMYLKLNNRDYDQNYLSDSELNLEIETENLKCEIVEDYQQTSEIIDPDVEWTVDDPVEDTSPKAYARFYKVQNYYPSIFSNYLSIQSLDSVNFVDYIDSSITYENGNFKYDTERIQKVFDLSDLKKNPVGTVVAWLQDKDFYIGADNKKILTDDLSYAFSYLDLKSIDFSNLYTEETTTMQSMFYKTAISKVNLSKLNTKNVTNMANMFEESRINNITGIEELDVSNVKDMHNMFTNIYNSNDLDLSDWDVSKVENINELFQKSIFRSVNLSNWNLSNVKESIVNVFKDASIQEVNLSHWKVPKVNMQRLFYQNKYIKNINVSYMDASEVQKMDNMFYETQLDTLDVTGLKTGQDVTAMFMFAKVNQQKGIEDMNVSNTVKFSSMFYKAQLYPANLNLSSWNMSKAQDVSSMFYDGYFPDLNLSNWDLSNVGSTLSTGTLTSDYIYSLNVSHWKLPADSNLGNLFSYVNNLNVLDMSYWDASRVKSMRYMLINAQKLQLIDMTGIDTSGVTDMGQMFQHCYELRKIIGIEDLDLGNVEKIEDMFFNCQKLESVDLHTWDVSKVTTMGDLFMYAHSLKEANLGGWNTANVTNMQNIFYENYNLQSVNVSGWDLKSLGTDGDRYWRGTVNDMFYKCSKLEYIDLSTWKNTSNFIGGMFGRGTDYPKRRTLDIRSFDYETLERVGDSLFNLDDTDKYTYTAYVKDASIKALLDSKYPNITVIVR